MASCDSFRQTALALPGVTEEPYRDATSFRVGGRVLATLWAEKNEANLKVTPELQSELVALNSAAFFPIPNSWGKKGWTGIRLPQVESSELDYALEKCRQLFS